MANLMDIYYKVGKSLYEKEFAFKTTEEKKVLVEGNLKNYVAGKIAEESTTKAIELSNNSKVSLDELVIMLGELIPTEEHFDTIRHLTHFILNIAGEMQGWSIVWYEEQDAEFVDNPLMNFNEAGKIESLTTHKETSYVQTFQFVHEIFKETFMTKKKVQKQLTLKDTRNESNQ